MAAPLGFVRRLHGLQGVVLRDCARAVTLEILRTARQLFPELSMPSYRYRLDSTPKLNRLIDGLVDWTTGLTGAADIRRGCALRESSLCRSLRGSCSPRFRDALHAADSRATRRRTSCKESRFSAGHAFDGPGLRRGGLRAFLSRNTLPVPAISEGWCRGGVILPRRRTRRSSTDATLRLGRSRFYRSHERWGRSYVLTRE
jgi:hypothetical protein